MFTLFTPLIATASTLPKVSSAKFTNAKIQSGQYPIIELKSSGSSKVQYSVYQYSPSIKKYVNVSGGFTSAVTSSKAYKIKLNKTYIEGENRFIVWVKRPNTKPANSSGYDTKSQYNVNATKPTTINISQATVDPIEEAVGVTPSIKVKSTTSSSIQYKVELYSPSLGIWEDASGGYTAPVEGQTLTRIQTTVPLKPGVNTYKIYAKKTSSQTADSYITKEVKVDPTLTKIDFCEVNPFKIKPGDSPELDIITSSTEKTVQYKIFSYSYTDKKWEEIQGYSKSYNQSENLTLTLPTTVKKGKNKFLIWTKSPLIEGMGYEDYKVIEFDSESETGPIPPSNGKTKIVIDPGHGGFDPGAKGGIISLFEKDIALQVALQLGSRLESLGYQILYTRNSDVTAWNSKNQNESLKYRYTFANNNNADLFISLHCNSGGGKGTGIESYYSSSRPSKDKEFASSVHSQVIRSTTMIDRKLKAKDFQVVKYTNMPSILLEMGFIDHPSDAYKLGDPVYQEKLVDGIIKGITKYKGI
ncbi:MAG: N-acetylmuramoyl-L-alanine amidase [Clostridium sp.]